MRHAADRPPDRPPLRRAGRDPSPSRARHGHSYRPLDADGQRRVEEHTWLAYQAAWRFARHHARDIPADELIAEALFALTYAAGRYRENLRVPFGAYATMVIRHWLIQSVRRWRRGARAERLPTVMLSQGEEAVWEVADRPGPDAHARMAAREMCERVRRVLPARLYKILRLHHGEGYSLTEVGDRLGLTRQRVSQLLIRARHQLRQTFPEWMGN